MKISWTKFESATREALEKMVLDKYKPNFVVAIGSSGIIPAIMVAKALNISDLQIIKVTSYNEENKRSEAQVLESGLSRELKNKIVLCVDDVFATGGTAEVVRKEILKFKPKKLKFLVPVVSEFVCKDYPDYWGRSILRSSTDFISMPWDDFYKIPISRSK